MRLVRALGRDQRRGDLGAGQAYRQLEHEGLAAGRPGQGTFITGALAGADPGRYRALRRSLEHWLREARSAGLSEEAVTALISIARHDLGQEGVA